MSDPSTSDGEESIGRASAVPTRKEFDELQSRIEQAINTSVATAVENAQKQHAEQLRVLEARLTSQVQPLVAQVQRATTAIQAAAGGPGRTHSLSGEPFDSSALGHRLEATQFADQEWVLALYPKTKVEVYDRAWLAIRNSAGNPSCGLPWAALFLFAKKGSIGERYDKRLEEEEKKSTQKLAFLALRRRVFLYLRVRGHYRMAAARSTTSETAAPTPWSRFVSEDDRNFCAEVKNTTSSGGTCTQCFIALLGDLTELLHFVKSDGRDGSDGARALATDLASHFASLGGNDTMFQDLPDEIYPQLLYVISQICRDTSKQAIASMSRNLTKSQGSGSRKRRRVPTGESDSLQRMREAKTQRLCSVLKELEHILGVLKKEIRNKTSSQRKMVRNLLWRHLGYALYATIRERSGWEIVVQEAREVSRGDEATSRRSGTGTTADDAIADAQVPVLDETLEPMLSFHTYSKGPQALEEQTDGAREDSQARGQHRAGADILKTNAKANLSKFDELIAAYPELTIRVTRPIRLQPSEFTLLGSFATFKQDLAKSCSGQTSGLPTDVENAISAEDLWIPQHRNVSLHEIALMILMQYSDMDVVTERGAFFAVNSSSLQAVHAVAQSLHAAVKYGLSKGSLDACTSGEKACLGPLRPFQVTSSTQGGETQKQATEPGLVTVKRLPWEDEELPKDNTCARRNSYSQWKAEDSFFLHNNEQNLVGKNMESSLKQINDAELMERYVSRDDFLTHFKEYGARRVPRDSGVDGGTDGVEITGGENGTDNRDLDVDIPFDIAPPAGNADTGMDFFN